MESFRGEDENLVGEWLEREKFKPGVIAAFKGRSIAVWCFSSCSSVIYSYLLVRAGTTP